MRRTPPGSFLTYRAATVNELLYQVNRDSTARKRYARHFGVGPQQIGSYFRKLKLIALKSPQRVPCWYIDKQDRCRVKGKYLAKGTLVFAAPDNKPVLSWSCGNPIGKHPFPLKSKLGSSSTAAPERAAKSPPAAKATPAEVAQTAPEPETKVLPGPAEIITAELPAPEVVALAPEVAEVFAAPIAAAPAQIVEAVAAPVSSGLGSLPYIGGIAGLVGGIVAFGGGGGDDPAAPLPPPATIPEPATFVTLGLGALGFYCRSRFPSATGRA